MTYSQPECAGKKLARERFEQLDVFIEHLHVAPDNPRRKDTLIQTLHRAQGIFGYLPVEVQQHIARKYSVSHAEVSGIISFYNYFSTTPKGEVQINICLGTACYVNGAEKVLQEFERILNVKSGEVTPDGQFSIESLRCIGACGLAPVAAANNRVYGKVQPEKVQEILEHYLVEESTRGEADHAEG